MAVDHELAISRQETAVANLQGHLEREPGHANRLWLRLAHPAENLPQALTVKLAMSRGAELVSPEESEGTDFFTAIQAAHEVPS